MRTVHVVVDIVFAVCLVAVVLIFAFDVWQRRHRNVAVTVDKHGIGGGFSVSARGLDRERAVDALEDAMVTARLIDLDRPDKS